MPQVLTTNAQILCAHLTPAAKNPPLLPLWTIDGGTVLVEGDSGTFSACPSIFPCGVYVLSSMGLNATEIVTKKVILVTDFNISASGLPITMIETHPVIDNTTPVPIPDGQPAPPLPPELADNVKPVVTSSVSTLGFSHSGNAPPTNSVTFSLVSDHPMRWLLTQIDEPEGHTNDRTDSQPTGMTITPGGGQWNVSPLNLALELTAGFMGTLAVGDHRFFLTGVSQRGLSNFAEVVLTVTA